ncbi:Laminin-like protein epi-1 [Oryzias melastigma]|uniref:Laminin-like protein epi-1 n=1 Tax=Oryzias melastigma TaxID=30732 RepID=A0A834L2J4_ORYME|nr:Laminin-like protein epi-1 [Oryzias melastigma]
MKQVEQLRKAMKKQLLVEEACEGERQRIREVFESVKTLNEEMAPLKSKLRPLKEVKDELSNLKSERKNLESENAALIEELNKLKKKLDRQDQKGLKHKRDFDQVQTLEQETAALFQCREELLKQLHEYDDMKKNHPKVVEQRRQLGQLKKELEDDISRLRQQKDESEEMFVQSKSQRDEVDLLKEETTQLTLERNKLMDLLKQRETSESNYYEIKVEAMALNQVKMNLILEMERLQRKVWMNRRKYPPGGTGFLSNQQKDF